MSSAYTLHMSLTQSGSSAMPISMYSWPQTGWMHSNTFTPPQQKKRSSRSHFALTLRYPSNSIRLRYVSLLVRCGRACSSQLLRSLTRKSTCSGVPDLCFHQRSSAPLPLRTSLCSSVSSTISSSKSRSATILSHPAVRRSSPKWSCGDSSSPRCPSARHFRNVSPQNDSYAPMRSTGRRSRIRAMRSRLVTGFRSYQHRDMPVRGRGSALGDYTVGVRRVNKGAE